MKGLVTDIEKITEDNTDYRRVLHTAEHSQLVVMNIQPGDEIGEEVHKLDQFIRIEEGRATAVLDGEESEMKEGFAVVVPAGVKHNIVNTGGEELKLYSIYSPPEHRDGVVHKTKAEAEADDEHYEG